MPYTVPPADLTVGPRMMAQGFQSAAGSINEMFSTMGKMYLQDKQGEAIIGALKQAGYGTDHPGQPGSAMIPPALFSAADKGPLGTKSALSQVMLNYLNMQYAMRMAAQKYGMENGGFVNPQGGQGGQAPKSGASPAQSFDLNNAPSSQAPQGPWNGNSGDDDESIK